MGAGRRIGATSLVVLVAGTSARSTQDKILLMQHASDAQAVVSRRPFRAGVLRRHTKKDSPLVTPRMITGSFAAVATRVGVTLTLWLRLTDNPPEGGASTGG